jgi:hypothetical protein
MRDADEAADSVTVRTISDEINGFKEGVWNYAQIIVMDEEGYPAATSAWKSRAAAHSWARLLPTGRTGVKMSAHKTGKWRDYEIISICGSNLG